MRGARIETNRQTDKQTNKTSNNHHQKIYEEKQNKTAWGMHDF